MIAMPAARPDQKSEPIGRESSSSPCLETAAWTIFASGGLRSSTSRSWASFSGGGSSAMAAQPVDEMWVPNSVAPAKAGAPAGEKRLYSSPPGAPAFAGATVLSQRGINERLQLPPDRVGGGRHQLGHEDHMQPLDRVDEEGGREHAAP